MRDGPTTATAELFSRAIALHSAGRLDDAASLYEGVLCAAPDHLSAFSRLCLCRLYQGDLAAALRLGRCARILDADAADAWHALGAAQAACGQDKAAIISLRRMLSLRPDVAEGHNNLGNLLTRQGNFAEAENAFRDSLRLKPIYPEAHYNLGNLLAMVERPHEAARCFSAALAILPAFAEAGNNLGVTLQAMGQYQAALAPLERAVTCNPRYGDALFNLANGRHGVADFAGAQSCFRKAITLDPGSERNQSGLGLALHRLAGPESAFLALQRAVILAPWSAKAGNNLADHLAVARAFSAAHDHYRRAIILDPGPPEGWHGLANSLSGLGQRATALALYGRALQIQPDHAEAHNNFGTVLQALERCTDAILPYRRAIALQPDYGFGHNNLASASHALDRIKEALISYRRALVLSPEDGLVHNNLGIALLEAGAFGAAHDCFSNAVDLEPRRGFFYRTLADTGRLTPTSRHWDRLMDLAEDIEALPDLDRMELHFALGRVFDDQDQPDLAFQHLLAANHLKRATTPYDEAASLGMLRRLQTIFDSDLLDGAAESGDPSALPIFVLGMPRSGTSLVEQILASHGDIKGAGERRDLRKLVDGLAGFPEIMPSLPPGRLRQLGSDYVAALAPYADGALRVIDKMPSNFELIGLISLALPHARIIHISRDPIDCCLSCFSKLFAGDQPFAYDLSELGRYYRVYEDLMEHWRRVLPPGMMLEVSYETLVNDLEGEARRMIDFCGLPWDNRCLDFHRTVRLVRTASATQVRRPIYQSAIGRWRRYGEAVRPLLDALATE
jgi:tetratricopeptide (TPR) repeat protein